MFDIGRQFVRHSSVLTRNGVITCGGAIGINLTVSSVDCILQTKNGTSWFPSMNQPRMDYGLALSNDKLFAIGGMDILNNTTRTLNNATMETIDINGKNGRKYLCPF